jgi:hypothetical protein
MSATARPELTLEAFERGDIDADGFDHEGHVFLGWLYLERYPLLDALRLYGESLKRLTANLGVPHKYHETITWFFLAQIDARRRLSGAGGWRSFRRQNEDLFEAGTLLARYYSPELLRSDAARRNFLLPDRIAEAPALRTTP